MNYKRNLGLRDFKWQNDLTIRGNLTKLKLQIKRAFHRFWSGVDPFAYWGTDFYFFEYLMESLIILRDKRYGSPSVLPCKLGVYEDPEHILICGKYDNKNTICEHCEYDVHKLWSEEIDKVIGWLKEWLECADDFDYGCEIVCDRLQSQIFEWLNKYWRHLWD